MDQAEARGQRRRGDSGTTRASAAGHIGARLSPPGIFSFLGIMSSGLHRISRPRCCVTHSFRAAGS
jgi:hypothetical protein